MTVLIVDDQKTQREMLSCYLSNFGLPFDLATNGKNALQLLKAFPEKYEAILLDRIMPELDGLETLKQIKANPIFQNIPVIMQTAMSKPEEIGEGIASGAYYYLTKPIDAAILKAVLFAALDKFLNHKKLCQELQKLKQIAQSFKHCEIYFQSPQEVKNIVPFLASVSPNSNLTSLGLHELMLNAVEHGNLGIGYDEKTEYILQGTLFQEIDSRLHMQPYSDRFAKLEFLQDKDHLEYRITDQGKGFDWEKYMEITPERVFDVHGRGIAIANKQSFDHIEYKGCGNQVICNVQITS